jgi:Xaa-Pro aminopeptidase
MYQTFDSGAQSADASAQRVKRLRALMADNGLDAFVVPRGDRHQGEYVAACDERLRWLTGFTGSAGMAVIGRRAAVLFVDGRYTVQARQQVDTDLFEILQIPEAKIGDWLLAKLASGAMVGIDPWLHSIREVERLTAKLAARKVRVKAVGRNLVDVAWGKDRPAPPNAAVSVHPLKFAGRAPADKIAAVQKRLKVDGQDAVVLTSTDSVAWLLNIRGRDVAHTPVVLAFAIVPVTGRPTLFVDPAKVGKEAAAHLAPLANVEPPKELGDALTRLKQGERRVRVDPDRAAFWFARKLGRTAVVAGEDPCVLPKAIKTTAEIKGARAAHVRDGAALTRFLAWIDREAPRGAVDEIGAVAKLEELRRESNLLQDISFDTISGSGPNGAIVHYRVSESSNRRLRNGELFLIDSGGQYLDGTTDVTRTVAIGRPTAAMRQRFTAVLKGHIAITTARFPRGTRGIDLDPFARRPLWSLGLDYDHGTGHGVGSFLSVHEGPGSISRRGLAPLEPGMILSNEPGYYEEGAYGIRIENLVLVTEAEGVADGSRPMMGFETLTLVPIDRRLVDTAALSEAERTWLDAYHARVRQELSSQLAGSDRDWLEVATRPLEI